VGVAIVIIIVALIGIGHTRPASPAAPATPAPRAAAVIMVPDLIGLSPAAATAELAAAGLRPQFEIDPNGSPGVVSSETPTAGTVVAPGSTILVRTGAGSS
jgi:beta-lactam-binding protein with PASTA domain